LQWRGSYAVLVSCRATALVRRKQELSKPALEQVAPEGRDKLDLPANRFR
jgi:hypothetical protein